MKKEIAKEIQNQEQIDTYLERGSVKLGPWCSHIWRSDPKHLGFLLARYKFCAKMLAHKSRVLEIGCGDGVGLPLVLQGVDSVFGIDFEPQVLSEAVKNVEVEFQGRCRFAVHDITAAPIEDSFDGAYSLDVIEHLSVDLENSFMENICASLKSDAVLILGTPNICASAHASKASRQGHVNLKDEPALRALMQRYFQNTFIFSMNDEIVHTGFYPMANYLLAVGAGVREHGVE